MPAFASAEVVDSYVLRLPAAVTWFAPVRPPPLPPFLPPNPPLPRSEEFAAGFTGQGALTALTGSGPIRVLRHVPGVADTPRTRTRTHAFQAPNPLQPAAHLTSAIPCLWGGGELLVSFTPAATPRRVPSPLLAGYPPDP